MKPTKKHLSRFSRRVSRALPATRSLAILCLAAAGTARATDYTWTGGAGISLWADVTKWTPEAPVGGPNGAGDKAIHEVGGSTAKITTGDAITLGTLQLRSTAAVLVDGSGELNVGAFTASTAGGFSLSWTEDSIGSFGGPFAAPVSSNMHIRDNAQVTATGTVNIAATGNGLLNLQDNALLEKTSNTGIFVSTSTSNSAGTTNGILTIGGNAELRLASGLQKINLYSPSAKVGTSNRTLVSTVNVNGGNIQFSGFIRGGSTPTTGNAIVNLNGGLMTIWSDVPDFFSGFALTNDANSNVNVLAGGLKLDTNGFSAGIAQNLSGAGGLTKSGEGTLTLGGTSTYGGATTVEAGTLSVGAANGLPATTDVWVEEGATLNLAGGTTTVNGLLFAGVAAYHGVWGAEGSGATYTSSRITGSGFLNVTTGPDGPVVTDPYTQWAAALPADKRARGDDADQDGLTNLQEYLFGTDAQAANGTVVASQKTEGGLLVTWNQRAEAATYQLKESTDLGATPWTDSAVVPENAPDQTGVPAGYVKKQALIPTSSPAKFVRVSGQENSPA